MTLNDVSRDRQTQSQAVRRSRFIPGHLSEGLENVRQKLCEDTTPGIAYCYLRVCAAACEPNTYDPRSRALLIRRPQREGLFRVAWRQQ
jgi:hypothetical protein